MRFLIRHGTASHDSYSEDMYRTLLESYQQLEQEMATVAAEWQECEKRIDDYVDEQVHTHPHTHTDREKHIIYTQFPCLCYIPRAVPCV